MAWNMVNAGTRLLRRCPRLPAVSRMVVSWLSTRAARTAAESVVQQANNAKPLPHHLQSFTGRCGDGPEISVNLRYVGCDDVDPVLFGWMFRLVKENMEILYGDDWDDEKKVMELCMDDAHFIVAHNASRANDFYAYLFYVYIVVDSPQQSRPVLFVSIYSWRRLCSA